MFCVTLVLIEYSYILIPIFDSIEATPLPWGGGLGHGAADSHGRGSNLDVAASGPLRFGGGGGGWVGRGQF